MFKLCVSLLRSWTFALNSRVFLLFWPKHHQSERYMPHMCDTDSMAINFPFTADSESSHSLSEIWLLLVMNVLLKLSQFDVIVGASNHPLHVKAHDRAVKNWSQSPPRAGQAGRREVISSTRYISLLLRSYFSLIHVFLLPDAIFRLDDSLQFYCFRIFLPAAARLEAADSRSSRHMQVNSWRVIEERKWSLRWTRLDKIEICLIAGENLTDSSLVEPARLSV